MKSTDINIKDFIMKSIGSTSWAGETYHDDESSVNLGYLDAWLTVIEDIRDDLLDKLNDHRIYREGNASAEHLHDKAGGIMKKHIVYCRYDQMTEEEFKEYWEGQC